MIQFNQIKFLFEVSLDVFNDNNGNPYSIFNSGWINGAAWADKNHPAVSAMMFCCAALFTLLFILKVFLLRKVITLSNPARVYFFFG